MDGTGRLFARFADACPEGFETQVIALPGDHGLAYDDLAEYVRPRLPSRDHWVLLGESFSGPLALRLAVGTPGGLLGVILSTSFVRAPGATRWAGLIARWAARIEPPAWALRRFLTGGDPALADEMRDALADVAADAIAARLRAIAAADATDSLRQCTVPVLVLRGTRDRVVGRSAYDTIVDIRPDATVVDVDAPHLLLQAAPTAAWTAIANEFGVSSPRGRRAG